MTDINTYDYEFDFTSGSFDQTVYDECTLPDNLSTRQSEIESKVNQIVSIFSNLPNLNKFSTFYDDGTYRYKITVTNV